MPPHQLVLPFKSCVEAIYPLFLSGWLKLVEHPREDFLDPSTVHLCLADVFVNLPGCI